MPPTASVPKGITEGAREADKKLEAINQGTPVGNIPPVETPAPAPIVESAAQAASAPIPGARPGETPEETAKRLSQALVVLQGKYNKEVPHLMRENSQLKKELEITEADRNRADAWGVEPEEIAGFKQNIVRTIEERGSRPAQTDDPKRDTYITTLDALVGGEDQRRATIKNPAFNQFLDMVDSNTGRAIRDIAEEADAANDAGKVAEVYQAFFHWKNGQTGHKPKSGNLMPDSQGAGSGDLSTGRKPLYTKAQYEAFQNRVRRGEFRTHGKAPALAEKIQAEYSAWSNEFASAMREGRIRG